MKSWSRYQKRFCEKVFSLEMGVIEKCLIASMLGALLVNGCFVFVGRNIGDAGQIRLAKLQAQQELMASQHKAN